MRLIFANVPDAIHLHHDCRSAARLAGFGENLALCLGPILNVVAGQTTISDVNFFGALPDHFMQTRIIRRDVPMLTHFSHECGLRTLVSLNQ